MDNRYADYGHSSGTPVRAHRSGRGQTTSVSDGYVAGQEDYLEELESTIDEGCQKLEEVKENLLHGAMQVAELEFKLAAANKKVDDLDKNIEGAHNSYRDIRSLIAKDELELATVRQDIDWAHVEQRHQLRVCKELYQRRELMEEDIKVSKI